MSDAEKDIVERAKLEQMQLDCDIPNLPTQLTYQAVMAISGEGPRAYDWQDKPHRIVYDLCREVEAQDVAITTLRAEVERLTALTAAWAPSGDETLPEDKQIASIHPTKSGDHDGYMEAMRLVGAKRSKGALVDLVHWLLTFKARAEKMEAAGLEAVICAEANCLTKDAPATARLRASLTEGE